MGTHPNTQRHLDQLVAQARVDRAILQDHLTLRHRDRTGLNGGANYYTYDLRELVGQHHVNHTGEQAPEDLLAGLYR